MLELSGLQRQEVLVVKACATTKDLEGYAAILVDHYSGIHMREEGRSWNGPTCMSPKGKGFANRFGKGKGFQRQAHPVCEEEHDTQETWEEDPEDCSEFILCRHAR